MNPYLGWNSSTQDTQFRAIAGYGIGEIGIDQINYQLQTINSTYNSIGVSGKKRIIQFQKVQLEGGESELLISGQSWFTRQGMSGVEGLINSMETDAGHYRIGLKGAHTQHSN